MSLIGAGPGNPALLTRAALDRMASADVVLHDALLPPSLLALVPPRAHLVAVGKEAGRPGVSQEGIHGRLIAESRAGRRVVRLKGGDPFIFGRGGEEVDALIQADLPFEIIPGVTAALGAAAEYSIPLTLRGVARSIRILTATTAPGAGATVERPVLASSAEETLVFYMAGRKLDLLREELRAAGYGPATPAAVIERATWADSTCRLTTLDGLGQLARARRVRTPALLVLGAVVSEAWRDRRRDRRGPKDERAGIPAVHRLARRESAVVVAGVLQDLSLTAEPFRRRGIPVHEVPLLRVRTADPAPLERRLRSLHTYGRVHFRDPHTVDPFLQALLRGGSDLRSLAPLRLVAEDEPTSAALARFGLRADAVLRQAAEGSSVAGRLPTLCLAGPAFSTRGTGITGAEAGRADRADPMPARPEAGAPDQAEPGDRSTRADTVAVYDLEPMAVDLEGLREDLRLDPPRFWILTTPAARRELTRLLNVLDARASFPRANPLATETEAPRHD